MIAVVDYQKGNLKSVERGLQAAGAQALITADPAQIAQATCIVLPGVGAFADAAATMEELGQMQVIRDRVRAGVPFLGICLGMHLLFEEGVEGAVGGMNPKGLGLIHGCVGELPRIDAAGVHYKIPHVGWNTVDYIQDEAGQVAPGAQALFAGIPNHEHFYFTHSFAAPNSAATIATTTHSNTFPCAVQFEECAFGVQFHPEKSSDAGMALLKNFVALAKEA